MAEAWPLKSPYFLDLLYFDEDMPVGDKNPVHVCFNRAHKLGQLVVPVTGSARSPEYQESLQVVVGKLKTGLCLRLTNEDLEDEDQLTEIVNALTSYFKLKPADVDMVLDIGSVANTPAATIAKIHRANIDLLPTVQQWRSLTVVAGAFPTGLAPLTRGTWNQQARADWNGWQKLVTSKQKHERLPSYGDYAIAHPDLPPSGRATILAQLRYTTEQEFMIWKGHNVFEHQDGFKQFYAICEDMIKRPEYRGPDFSAGDEEISEKAANHDSPGNAETWRRIGTNHHLETVKEQLANFPWT